MPAVRSSSRTRNPPIRYNPSTAALPSDHNTMITGLARNMASRSEIPFEAEAVSTLESVLEGVLGRSVQTHHTYIFTYSQLWSAFLSL